MSRDEKAFGDRDILEDMLASQREVATAYNQMALDSAHGGLKNAVITILGEEQQIASELFAELEKRGWVTVNQADQAQIDKALEQFQK